MVKMLPCDAFEDDAEGWRLQVIVQAEIELVPMNSGLENKQTQDHQMVLKHRKKSIHDVSVCIHTCSNVEDCVII